MCERSLASSLPLFIMEFPGLESCLMLVGGELSFVYQFWMGSWWHSGTGGLAFRNLVWWCFKTWHSLIRVDWAWSWMRESQGQDCSLVASMFKLILSVEQGTTSDLWAEATPIALPEWDGPSMEEGPPSLARYRCPGFSYNSAGILIKADVLGHCLSREVWLDRVWYSTIIQRETL